MQRKSSHKTRSANTAERRYQAWCKDQGCVACAVRPVDVHHCGGSTLKAKVDLVTVLIGHWFCIPLCAVCHWQYHNSKAQFLAVKGKQWKLWRHCMARYGDCPEEVRKGIMGSNI